MEFSDFDTTLNIDYAGCYLEEGSERELPILKLRLYIFKDPHQKVCGVNMTSLPSTRFNEAIDSLCPRIDIWLLEKYKLETNTKEILMKNEDLKSKFNRWLGIRPQALMQARTITVRNNL